MIINGGSYRNVRWWANHLQSKDNDRARVVKSYGLQSDDILEMFQEMPGMARILGGDKIDAFQGFQCPESDIAEVSDRSGDDVKHGE